MDFWGHSIYKRFFIMKQILCMYLRQLTLQVDEKLFFKVTHTS